MKFRKFILLWALFALTLGQFTLAQHSASHIDHGFSKVNSIVSNHIDHEHEQDQNSHECHECLLTKSLQTAFYNAPAILLVPQKLEVLISKQYSLRAFNDRYNANSPRSPPALFI